jgi:ATPase family protein associated with various cellular activities (AAA)
VERRLINAFEHVPRNVRGHFLLNFYAAIHRLINHIRRLSEVGGEDLETTFEHYPFLAGYFSEMQRYMPEESLSETALQQWAAEIHAWEKACSHHLPLRALTESAGIGFYSRIAWMIVGLVEEDSRFGTIFSRLQEPLAYRRPCLELVGQMMLDDSLMGHADSWSICQPLFSSGLVDVAQRDAPRSEWMLRVPSILWDAVRGEVEAHPAPWCQHHPFETFLPTKALIAPEEFLSRLEQVPSLVMGGKAGAIVLRGTPGSERLQMLGAVARALDRGVIEVKGPVLPAERNWELLGPLCSMTCSMPVFTYDLGPGETVELAPLAGYNGPIGVLMDFEGGVRGKAVEKAVTLTIPAPRGEHRRRYWQEALAGHASLDLAAISERFHIPGGYIRQAAAMAIAHASLDQHEMITLNDIREACRALNRQLLDTLAVRLEVEGSWDHLVVSEATAAKLQELERRCHHREGLLAHLGSGFGASSNRGVRALFTGVSGTGKTLAAKILAAELGMDLYRVDLASVVNKYIGETEKNLHRVLSRAEELDVILLLDEGDALLGSRTEVKSANDRYANLETDYLLQRLEHYQGIVVVTTNAAQNIDTAFQRRMDVVINFLPPRPQERWHVWMLHLPHDHAVDPVYLEEVAMRCVLTGGQIRNAALHATLLALDDGAIVTHWHLDEAIRSEYRKAGALCPLNGNGRVEAEHGGMKAFLDLLSY